MVKKLFVGFFLSIILSIVIGMNVEQAEAAEYHEDAIAEAENHLGLKYKWGGTSPSTGFDCSGLVKYVFGKQGKDLPRTAAEQYEEGKKVKDEEDLEKGDLIFFANSKASKISHVAIYVGKDKFIHSASSKGVSYSTMDNVYWGKRIVGAKRI